ncbi:hypothetical protein B7463_g644, partial [Scytalidium lignicola]
MAPKRHLEDGEDAHPSKKHRSGFKVGPDNLPDGTWRRKVIKIKKDLIHKAKIKKSYSKLKAREGIPETSTNRYLVEDPNAETSPEPPQGIHPERQMMLDAADQSEPPEEEGTVQSLRNPNQRRRSKRPGYFEKELDIAENQKAEAEARKAEFEKREKEKQQKIAERERHRRVMGKARTGGKNGQRKLGLESKVLLDKVKKMVSE